MRRLSGEAAQPFQAPSPPTSPIFANCIRTPFSLKETAPNAPLHRYKYSLSIGRAHTSIFVWLLFHLHLLSQAFRVLFIAVGFKKKRMKVLLFRMTMGTFWAGGQVHVFHDHAGVRLSIVWLVVCYYFSFSRVKDCLLCSTLLFFFMLL